MKTKNTIYIGKKPTMSYVLAVVSQLKKEDVDEIKIKARGRAISKAVDVSEIVKNKFMQQAEISDIKTGTEKLEGDDGKKVNVSTFCLTMKK